MSSFWARCGSAFSAPALDAASHASQWPGSTITLAVAIYNLYETGYIEPVAALSMINMVIIGVAIWLAYRVGGRSISSRAEAAPVGT